ncbi:hypothetical protein OIU85_014238 [Salix viminalis]|uniref:DUF4283 domain-containing protein n=1 Tax=Salix viminalis TaxID=40686 RepID=A0A9Q0NND9_SALVM|nr:hypothetical protein OIU85_014238 [Salix viminalis]
MTAIKPSSWAERVRVSDSNSRCSLEKISRQPPGTILQIPKDMQLADADDWKRSMIGFFVSYKLPFYAVQSIANRIWKSHGLEKTMVLSNGFMVFRFSSVTQMEEVLARGPWMFGGKTILLQQWQPGFKFDRNKIKSIPVWARLQGLPFPLWNKQGLSMAASCNSLSEEPITVDVTYEWKPSRCETCKVFGHSCRPQAKEKERDIETLVTEDQKSEFKGKENGTHHANPAAVSKELHQQKPNHEEGPRINTMKENNEKVKPTSEGLTVGRKTGEHASTEEIPNQNKGNKAAAIVISPRDDLQGEPLICTMNKMVSVSSETKGKGKEIACEFTGSSSEGQGGHSSQFEINSPSPKQKKKKKGGKKRQGGHSPRQVSHNKIEEVQDSILPLNWAAINNVEGNSNCRIFVGWNTRRVHVQCIHVSDQWITCDIRKISSAHVTRFTFVYVSNNYGDRISLWQYLETESLNNASIPWSILGDFNAVLRPNDRSGGSSIWQNHHNDFPNCITGASLHQIPYSGIRFTWHNGQSGDGIIMRKLDWIFGNQSLLVQWPAARAVFLPRQVSDHSAMVLHLDHNNTRVQAPFKFLNQWAAHDDFLAIVGCIWQQRIVGNPFYQLTAKLSILKHKFRRKHAHCTSHISHRVYKAKEVWTKAQVQLDSDPQNMDYRMQERCYAKNFMKLSKEEEAFFKQRSRVQWLKLGDQNTKFFHRSLIHRRSRNSINSLRDDQGGICTNLKEMGDLAVNYFKNLLKKGDSRGDFSVENLYPKRVNERVKEAIVERLGLAWNARVSDIIEGIAWKFPQGSEGALDQLWNTVTFQPHVNCKDIWARISWPRLDWAPAWDLVVDRTRSENSARQRMVGIVIAASVYHLWQERNRRIYDHHYTGSERLIDDINFSIRGRLANLDRADELPESMLQMWDIH